MSWVRALPSSPLSTSPPQRLQKNKTQDLEKDFIDPLFIPSIVHIVGIGKHLNVQRDTKIKK